MDLKLREMFDKVIKGSRDAKAGEKAHQDWEVKSECLGTSEQGVDGIRYPGQIRRAVGLELSGGRREAPQSSVLYRHQFDEEPPAHHRSRSREPELRRSVYSRKTFPHMRLESVPNKSCY
jgi:hypothetical protein